MLMSTSVAVNGGAMPLADSFSFALQVSVLLERAQLLLYCTIGK